MTALLTAPPQTTLTPDDLLRMPDEGQGFELVDGKLVKLNVSYLSSFVAGNVLALLTAHIRPKNLGWVSSVGVSFRCFPDAPNKVRRADVSFHQLDRLTPDQARAEGHCTVVPDLVVEVVSPNDLSNAVNEKRADWFATGARLVWVVHPPQQTVHAYRTDGAVALFTAADPLTGGPVLPDFRVPVAELFRLPAAV
jgi:Uma2 family endonuclease